MADPGHCNKNIGKLSLTFEKKNNYNELMLLAGEGSSLAPLPFPFSNLGASPASALSTDGLVE
jgi:hypothetical protein